MKYLTKSRFKLAAECPTKLFYTGKKLYANKSLDNPFLEALADGGFQVEELSRLHYKNGVLIAEQRFISVVIDIPMVGDFEVSSPIRSVTATTDLALGDTIEFKITALALLGVPLASINVFGGDVESFCSVYQIR